MRILIVEDEHKIAHSLKKGLEQERYTVDAVYTGTDGLDYALSEDYDLLILDRMLPGMDGIEIVRQLRAKHKHTPILMLTARGQLEDRVEGLDTGADDYLVKPFAFTEFLARVKALLRRPKQANETKLTVADLSLDTTTFAVTRNNRQISLSAKEYALLAFLMRHAGTVVTKDQIISQVWNYDANVLPNSVEVYIKHLRNKIDNQPGTNPLIKTVRGFGYKISED